MSGSGISWAICKSAPCSRQITTPAPQHSVFYRPDALPAAKPTVSKHWMPLHLELKRTFYYINSLTWRLRCSLITGLHGCRDQMQAKDLSKTGMHQDPGLCSDQFWYSTWNSSLPPVARELKTNRKMCLRDWKTNFRSFIYNVLLY